MMKEQVLKNTPMMQQYLDIKARHVDMILFFRLGDFYEMFMDDAREVSRLLNLTLTQRAGVPMCGIPYHAARNYIKRLLDEGKKIAICEQVEMTSDVKSLARREVVQIITPATVVDDDYLDALSSSYIVCLASVHAGSMPVAVTDISSGEFLLDVLEEDHLPRIRSLIAQYRPKEILVDEDEYFSHSNFAALVDEGQAMVTKLPHGYFSVHDGFTLLCGHLGLANLKAFGIPGDHPSLAAGGAAMRYLMDTARSSLTQITAFRLVTSGGLMQMDEATRRNLEIVVNSQDGTQKFSLFDAVDHTRTAGGTRLLKSWLSAPITDMTELDRRHGWIASFCDDVEELKRVRNELGTVLDAVRLSSRVAMNKAVPHDLVSIKQTISTFFRIVSEKHELYQMLLSYHVSDENLESLLTLMMTIGQAINEDSKGPFEEGAVIKDGYDAVLDELRGFRDHGTDILEEYLAKVKGETGITTLRLSYNKIIGHYLEVSKGQVDKVPANFYRKQTLVNAERYTTDELIACETRILRAVSDAEKRERHVYEAVMEDTRRNMEKILAVGKFLSELDVYQSHATLARERSYIRPEFVMTDVLHITEGRHPVVEKTLRAGTFVSNNLDMEENSGRFCLITGPNMAGKSTYLRQNALIVLLAQSGSFVPATSVRMGLVDRLYCRVGASDNLARGESTFLVEMQEAAHIIRTATPNSLVIMDEIGRGTSTQDGMSIACAIMRRLQEMRTKTLFATHYHELTMLDTSQIQLLTLEVAQKARKIIFMRKVIPGVANSSYGLHVAALAGLPVDVVRNAADFQKKHFADYNMSAPEQLDLFIMDDRQRSGYNDTAVLGGADDDESLPIREIMEELEDFSIDDSTPREALDFVASLKERLRRLKQET
ncbi:DNA mismatch repair protein MutS [Parasphaerochaeta coccoides]|uniref:DNA mismatch repair protein MutS n=1 Tax=Parasphaerochaeta coccoides (strain ATCC BAA-1237 / DSM 17374 / SPN1) TaxID=760011 RepID=F4GK46_PARC1|nr:DNA mismatch repair protein MutS [Parasphaerochaeta coccoides]AEC01818.1 DNA mismatch repair protein mutS [Parasphaerochaeta coccoides DSM 17374]